MKLLINLESKLCVLIVFICAISLTACGGGGGSGSGGGSSPSTYTSGTLPNSEFISINAIESIIYSFLGQPDGVSPWASLIRDESGNLYGTTWSGGSNNQGTVFKISPDGQENVIYSFGGSPDGANPYASLIRDESGNLYGTTIGGGSNNQGTVFKISADGKESVIHRFGNNPDGAKPRASLIRDELGNLYGTTSNGGSNNKGTVFKISPDGQENVIYSFSSYLDGSTPCASLIRDESGNLYGTTYSGGEDTYGTVFKISRDGQESVIYRFVDSPDGASPQASLIRDESGNLYGTTTGGGSNNKGTVFQISPDGQENVIHSFGGSPNDGAKPYASLIRDESGNLYGTTVYGGSNDRGTVFKISPNGQESVIYSFGEIPDGASPYNASLIRDESGNLYGTTRAGGGSGYGTVFKIYIGH